MPMERWIPRSQRPIRYNDNNDIFLPATNAMAARHSIGVYKSLIFQNKKILHEGIQYFL